MPKPRFHNLDAPKQARILAVAAEEFAASGFEAASYNHIMQRAQVSKGAMYYYFENKADLYTTVVVDCVQRFLAFLGTMGTVHDAARFWEEAQGLSRRSMVFYRKDPNTAGLVRSLARSPDAAPVGALRDLYRAWYADLLATGQRVGAVRTDLPIDALLAVAIALSEAMDVWLADHVDTLDDEGLARIADKLADLFRRVATPEEER